MSQPTTRDRLVAALHDLGDTTGKVDATLTKHRITGVPNNGSACAIVRWLELQVPETAGRWGLYADMTAGSWFWINGEWLQSTDMAPIPVPQAVRDFLFAFDSGLYPHLIASRAVAA